MTSAELLAYCRTRLDDLVGTDSTRMFPDSEVYGYLSDCQETVAAETLVLRGNYTLTLTATTSEVSHNAAILRVDDAIYTRSSVVKRLYQVMPEELPLTISAGDPGYFSIAANPGYVSFDAAPEADASIKLRVRRMPTNAISAVNQPEIPASYHRRLVNGVLGYAFAKPDVETYNINKSMTYFKLFAQDIEAIKRMDLQLHKHGLRFRYV